MLHGLSLQKSLGGWTEIVAGDLYRPLVEKVQGASPSSLASFFAPWATNRNPSPMIPRKRWTMARSSPAPTYERWGLREDMIRKNIVPPVRNKTPLPRRPADLL